MRKLAHSFCQIRSNVQTFGIASKTLYHILSKKYTFLDKNEIEDQEGAMLFHCPSRQSIRIDLILITVIVSILQRVALGVVSGPLETRSNMIPSINASTKSDQK